MFDPQPRPRLFALPPGVDFPKLVAQGLIDRLAGQPPDRLARVDLLVNTVRMRTRLVAALTASGARLLPRVRTVASLGQQALMPDVPMAAPPLRQRLELTQLIAALIDADPTIAPRAATYDLADSLAALMEEMQGEGVDPSALARLDLAEHSDHWTRSRDFISIIAPFFAGDGVPGVEARQRLAVLRQIARWQAEPPDHPVIVAGSTGSRGTTALLMAAVARLPQGAVIVPGFDLHMADVWPHLDDALSAEDHPQFRFKRLFDMLGIAPDDVALWARSDPESTARNRLVSLSLRPAPVTDQWMVEAPLLGDLRSATSGLTLVEAASPRHEALVVALAMRAAVDRRQKVALITPDRTLARQVTAALDRWAIYPDDSAGQPLALSAPGRFLRHASNLFGRKLTAEALLVLLKHPLCASGADRGIHLLHSHDLELSLRRDGPLFPQASDLTTWAGQRDGRLNWATWLGQTLPQAILTGSAPLADHVTRTIALAEDLARGPDGHGAGELWQAEAGAEALAAARELLAEAQHGGTMTATDFADLLTAVLMRRDVRSAVRPHPDVMIWGTLDARAQGADVVVMGGLNEGVWPAAPPPDPWLNRKMRLDLGLLLPERRIGLSAHDYQQAIAAKEVMLTRAIRDAEADTLPSRWVNRLGNLLRGSPANHGPEALAAMRGRGQVWLALADGMDRQTDPVPAEKRPAPCPPVAHRPTELFVTRITQLIRDPYAIYARHILRLKKLDPLHAAPNFRERGTTLHRILQDFVAGERPETLAEARVRLMLVADRVLLGEIPWPVTRRMWRARLERVADWFLATEADREGAPVLLEEKGSVTLETHEFSLSAKPDRIDRMPDGSLVILDYKSGALPSAKVQEFFDKQLPLEAAMAERGAFAGLGKRRVPEARLISLGTKPAIEVIPFAPGDLDRVWAEFGALIGRYMQRDQGYASRRAIQMESFVGDYDHLARHGEWQDSDAAHPVPVGPPEDRR